MKTGKIELILTPLFVLFLFCSKTVCAQTPLVGTEDDPVWYYIQVQGDNDGRADRVFTADGTQVFGRAMVLATNSPETDKQLWRFEKNGNNYILFNKANGKKLNITYNSSQSITVAALNDNPVTQWQLVKSGDYYNLRATVAPSGGDASKIYAHQANNWDNRNFVIMFESTSYNSTPNSRFRFILYEDYTIELSTEENEIWYCITSAKQECLNKGITDIVSDAHPEIKFSLETIVPGNEKQLWKAVGKSNGLAGEHIDWINKATGNIIQTASLYRNSYYYTQYTDQPEQSNGWLTRYLGGGQFEIYGQENDGVTRYLNAASKEQQQPDCLIDDNTKDTGFAWIVKKAGDFSALDKIPEQPQPYSKSGRIMVEGNNDYIIRNVQGLKINRHTALPAGIYLVTVNEKTTKILVK
ncbi:MAG: RICIN domain-containing protein [Candidatus Symbiothrix sp.]|jgi:hypothetical protein|nr:RICIN domain-containing protein [Candidatus Symbiothrix sp.]